MIWKLQNIDDRLICYSARSDNISPFLRDLHWLPVESCVQYRIRSLSFQPMSNQAPSYLSDLIQQYVPSRQIRSAADTRLPSADLKSSGRRAFFYQSPLLWIIPFRLQHCSLPLNALSMWVCVRQCALLLLLLCGPGEVCVCVSMSLLGLCALLRMIELASPTSKEIITVVVPLSSPPHKSGILFTSVPSLPEKLALQCISSKSILTLIVFSAA